MASESPVDGGLEEESRDPLVHQTLNTSTAKLITVTEAADVYTRLCQSSNMSVNNTFLKQLLSGTVLFEFDNGYLGGNGIVPIMQTLKQIAIRELVVPQCLLSGDDIKVICDAFTGHPTLTRIDLRGNTISLTSAKLIFTLVARTASLIEVQLDPNSPKYVPIQQQCIHNGKLSVTVGLCVLCQRPVTQHLGKPVEMDILYSIFEEFKRSSANDGGISEVVFELLFRLLLRCCEAGNGVLFLCDDSCAKDLGIEVYATTRTVVNACHVGCGYELPKVRVLKEYAEILITEFKRRQLPASAYKGALGKNVSSSFIHKGETLERFMKEDEHCCEVTKICAICGSAFNDGIDHVPLAFMTQLEKDLMRGAPTTPSAFLRLCQTMVQYSSLKACCSRRCIRQIERFALYGYWGTIRVFSAMLPLLSSIVSEEELLTIPSANFTLVDFQSVVIEDVAEEDITCALTVASAMEDIDGVPVDPYMIYAVGRHISKQPVSSIGMELKNACEAAHMVGCLAMEDAPFNRRNGQRPRRVDVADWNTWGSLGDVEKMLSKAFARRRHGVFSIDGPHKNVSENIRAALWHFRHQRRSVLACVKFCPHWLSLEDGIIPQDADPRGGFYTTVKIIGQTSIHSTPFLILQANFGAHSGFKGFFYMPMCTFNRYLHGTAYMFVDPTSLSIRSAEEKRNLYSELQVTPLVRTISEGISNVRSFGLLMRHALKLRCLTSEQEAALLNASRRLPPGMYSCIHFSDCLPTWSQTQWMRDIDNLLYYLSSPSQLLFLFNEVFGEDACRWLNHVLQLFTSGVVPLWSTAILGYYSQLLDPDHPATADSIRTIAMPESGWITPTVILPPQRRATAVPQSIEAVVKPRKRQSSGGKKRGSSRPLSRDGRGSAVGNHAEAEEKEAGGSSLKALWESERLAMQPATDVGLAQRLAAQMGDPNSCSSMLLNRETQHLDSKDYKHSADLGESAEGGQDTVAYKFIGETWSAMHLTLEDGTISSKIACILGDSVCLYDLATQAVLHPLTLMSEDHLFYGFPFSSGIDCVFHHPKNPRHVYVFSGEYGFIWDSFRMETVQGPFKLDGHMTFQHLPQVFMDAGIINSAVPIPGTSCVIFFTQLHYVVYDIEQGRPAGEVQILKEKEESEMASISQLQSEGMTELAKEMRKKLKMRRAGGQEVAEDEDEELKPHLPGLPEGFLQWFPCGPMTCLWDKATDNASESILLIGFGGHTAKVNLSETLNQSPKRRKGEPSAELPMEPLTHTYLEKLPTALRQMCTESIHPICDAIALRHLMPSSSLGAGMTRTKLYVPELDRMLVESGESARESGRPTVRSSFTPTDIAEQLPGLIMCPGALTGKKCTGLFTDEVLYHVTPPNRDLNGAISEEQPVSFIECDLGTDTYEAFGAVVLLLECSQVHPCVLRLAPAEIVIESSDDGIAFDLHRTMRASGSVASATWTPAHAARYWRLRFVTQLPAVVGIVRLLWYRSEWSPITATLSPMVAPALTISACRVEIEAGTLFKSPDSLFDNTGLSPVFAAPTSQGWYEKHCVLPLIGMGGNACLLFCGGSFLEYDMEKYEVASNRSIRLGQHPAFKKLPHPFRLGFDAIFYPDTVAQPNIVAMMRDGWQLQWNLSTGSQEGDILPCNESMFRGIPVDMNTVYDVVNVWGRRHEVLVLYPDHTGLETKFLQWNTETNTLSGRVKSLKEYEPLNYPQLKGKHLHCVFSMPTEPLSFYAFADDLVVSPLKKGDALPVVVSPEFYRIISFMPCWGKLRYDCSITIDLRADAQLVLGAEMRSSCGDQKVWGVECSEDGLVWRKVSTHIQTTGCSQSTWKPSCVGGVSHRFWRFWCESNPDEHSLYNEQVSSYSQLKMLTLPYCVHRATPDRFVTSGDFTGDFDSLIQSVSAEASSGQPCTPVNFVGTPGKVVHTHHVTLDYSISPVELCGFSCTSEAALGDTWSVYYSHDSNSWELCGSWTVSFSRVECLWMPKCAAPFWRFELTTKKSTIAYGNFNFLVHKGPSVVVKNLCATHGSHTTMATSVLWPQTSEKQVDEKDTVRLETAVGNTVTIDTKAPTAAVMGIDVHAGECTSKSVEFLVEYSNDCTHWYDCEALTLCSKQCVGSAYWPVLGSHRFWRLRITRSANQDGYLLLRDLRLTTTNYNLYRSYTSDKSNRVVDEKGLESVYLRLPTQRRIVRVRAIIPSNSEYAVERLSLDGVSWEMITSIKNSDMTASKEVVKAWPRCRPSTSWRLRYVGMAISTNVGWSDNLPPSRLSFPLQWFSFTNEQPKGVDVNQVDGLDVSYVGFEEVQPQAEMLSPLAPKDEEGVILRSSIASRLVLLEEDDKDSSVLWTFPYAVRFDKVFVSTTLSVEDIESEKSSPLSPNSKKNAKGNNKKRDKQQSGTKQPSTASGSVVNAEDGEEVVIPPPPSVTTIVETSFNGKDFAPLAEINLSPLQSGDNTLSWETDLRCAYWRIRFTNNIGNVVVDLKRVRWFVCKGVPSVLKHSVSKSLNNTVYSTWIQSAYNNSEAFMTQCRLGLDQAKSHASKLREEGDIDPIGVLAEHIVKMKKKYQGFVINVAKKAAKGASMAPEPVTLFSEGKELATDLLYFIHMSSVKYPEAGPSLWGLISLINHPMNIGKTVAYGKKDKNWFYPSFSVHGTLSSEFYGFANLPACYNVYWSLSLDLQRDTQLLFESDMVSEISPHVASPMVAVYISPSKWNPKAHFPTLSFLSYAGFGSCGAATIVAFAVNEVLFTDRYPLVIGEKEPKSLPFTHPFRVFPGVNFIQHVSLKACPAPIFEMLQRLYEPSFISQNRTTVVLTAPSMDSLSSHVRFRLPAAGLTLGFDCVTFDSIEFEVSAIAEPQGQVVMGSSSEDSGFATAHVAPKHQYMLNFVVHGGKYPRNKIDGVEEDIKDDEEKQEGDGVQEEKPPQPVPYIPFSVVGTLSANSPLIPICTHSPSAHLPFPYIDGSYISNISVSGSLAPTAEPFRFRSPLLTLTGELVLSTGAHYPCSYKLVDATAWELCDEVEVSMLEASLLDVMSFSHWLAHNRELPDGEETAWLRTLPLRVSMTLVVNTARKDILGEGTVRLYDHASQTATITVNRDGLNLCGTLTQLVIGMVTLETSPLGDLVRFNVGTTAPKVNGLPRSCGVLLSLEGYSNVMSTTTLVPLQMEVSGKGVVCIGSTNAFDISLEDFSTFPYFTRAQVTLCRELFFRAIATELEKSPIVVALRANGLPFTFCPQEFTMEPFQLRERRLNLTLRGVLFGCWFEVCRGFTGLSSSEESVRSIARPLAALIIEQCEESLWASYSNVIGCAIVGEGKRTTKSSAVNWHFTQMHGKFLSRWIERECKSLDAYQSTGL